MLTDPSPNPSGRQPTIFRGMNIHLPAILMFTRGTRFWHTAISNYLGLGKSNSLEFHGIFTANSCSTYTGRQNVMTAKPTSLNGQFAAPFGASRVLHRLPSFRAETPNLWSLWCFGRWNDLVQVLQMKPLRCRLRRFCYVSWENRSDTSQERKP